MSYVYSKFSTIVVYHVYKKVVEMKKNNIDDYVSRTKYLSGLSHMEYENNVFAIAFSTFLIKENILNNKFQIISSYMSICVINGHFSSYLII